MRIQAEPDWTGRQPRNTSIVYSQYYYTERNTAWIT